MPTNTELMILLFFFAIGFALYKILEQKIDTDLLSRIVNSLIVLEMVYLIFMIAMENTYSTSTFEMIIFGLILPHMLQKSKTN